MIPPLTFSVVDNRVSFEVFHVHNLRVRWQLRCTGAVGNGQSLVRLYTDLIPNSFIDKGLERLGAALHNQRLDTVRIEPFQVQWVIMVYDETFRMFSRPVSHRQFGMFTLFCHTSHKDGVFLSPQFMGEHTCKG